MRRSDLDPRPLSGSSSRDFQAGKRRGRSCRPVKCPGLALSALAAVLLPLTAALAVVLATAAPVLAQGASSDALSMDGYHSPFVKVAEKVTPAVVAIRTIHSADGDSGLQEMFREFFPPERHFRHPDFDVPGAGSGFVVSEDGYIVTNNHVISGADEIRVKLAGHEDPYPARIVGTDPATDLAVIKVDVDEALHYLRFGDSDGIRVGDWAIAIGNPLGQLEGSLTVGVISAKGRTDLAIEGADLLRYQDFLQTDAAINPGNSGGPLVDIRGNVIGVNTAINRSGQGIGFAIPARLTRFIYEQLVEFGRVRRGYLGIQMSSLHDWREQGHRVQARQGVVVTEVLPDTPAQRAGLRAGDVLTEFNGKRVTSIPDLRLRVAESAVGSTARLKISREGEERTLEVVLDEFDESVLARAAATADGETSKMPWLGLEVAPLDDGDPRARELMDQLDLRGEEGVLVVGVRPGSAADRARLRPGDLIVEIEGIPIPDLQSYRKVASARADDTRPLSLLVRRGEMNSYIEVLPPPAPPADEKP